MLQIGHHIRKTNDAHAIELAICESRRVHIISTGEYKPLGTSVWKTNKNKMPDGWEIISDR